MKKDYMARLERAARWRLPPEEAEDVIADYQDIVGDEELRRSLGKPRDVIAPLTPQKTYHIWLAVFVVLAACALLPALSALPGMWHLWDLFRRLTFCVLPLDVYNLSISPATALPFLGMAGALVWFRWKGGGKRGRLSPAVPALLVAAGVWSVAVLAADWFWMRDPIAFSDMWGQMPLYILGVRIGPPDYTVSRSFHILAEALEWGGFAMALLSVFALVKARTRDRRWAAVYILALTAVLLSAESLALVSNMEISESGFEWLAPTLRVWIVYAGAGFVGAGAALC